MLREWIQNIVVFLLLMSLVRHLVPEDSFGKYIRLTTGLILIMVMILPLLKWFHLENLLNQKLFQNQIQVHAADARLSSNLFETQHHFNESFRQIFKEEIETYFKNEGMAVEECIIEMNEDMDDENYGEIYALKVILMPMDQVYKEKIPQEGIDVQKIEIEDIKKFSNESERIIPKEKINEWKEQLSIQFGINQEKLTLEIVS